jgi:hypothetical protein
MPMNNYHLINFFIGGIEMLKKVYGIMEYYNCMDWPLYAEHYVDDDVMLILETDDGERLAYLYQDYNIMESQVMKDRRGLMMRIDVPKEFPLRWFVNKYRLTREYGGPEEGGWYWDCLSPTNYILCVDEDHAKDILKLWQKEVDQENEGEEHYCNVNSRGESLVYIENYPPMYPTRPTFE